MCEVAQVRWMIIIIKKNNVFVYSMPALTGVGQPANGSRQHGPLLAPIWPGTTTKLDTYITSVGRNRSLVAHSGECGDHAIGVSAGLGGPHSGGGAGLTSQE